MRSHSSRRQPRAGVGDFDHRFSVVAPCVRNVSVPPLGIASIAFSTRFDKARCSSSGSAAIVAKILVQLQLAFDRRASRRLQLRLKQLRHTRARFHSAARACNCGCGILENSLKRPMIVFRFEISASSVLRTFAKHFVELLRTLRPRAHQILHRELQREQTDSSAHAPGAAPVRAMPQPARSAPVALSAPAIPPVMRLNDSASCANLVVAASPPPAHSSFPPPLPAPPAPVVPPDASLAPPPNC